MVFCYSSKFYLESTKFWLEFGWLKERVLVQFGERKEILVRFQTENWTLNFCFQKWKILTSCAVLCVKIFRLGQHPLSKTLIDFLKRSVFEEQKFACKFPSNPLTLVGPTFQFFMFLPHWKLKQDYGGWPRRSIFKGKSSSLGGCGVNFYASMCKVEKIVDAKITENASYKFLFNA